jgi:hypothetical protein
MVLATINLSAAKMFVVNIQDEIVENYGNPVFQEIYIASLFGSGPADNPATNAIGGHFPALPWYTPALPAVLVNIELFTFVASLSFFIDL